MALRVIYKDTDRICCFLRTNKTTFWTEIGLINRVFAPDTSQTVSMDV